MTDKRFQIQVFAANEIVPPLPAADAVQKGTVEMAQTASYYYFGKDPTFAFGTAVPFGLNARMQNAWMYQGGGMELMNEFYKKFNIHALPAATPAARWAAGSAARSRRRRDLQGLKMRIGGFAGTVMAKLGVVPQQIPGGEIYPVAGERHDRRRRMGRPLRRREARLRQDRAVLLLSRLVGGRRHAAPLLQSR